ncbi:MAG: lipopolysaccharide kinase InaA family protein, partial [Candidatus Binatia bacterium]
LFSFPECEIIKDQRKIKVGRVQLEIGGKLKWIYLKRYNAFSWRYRLGSLFVPSAATRSWVGAGILMHAGFHTGQPIAAVECRSLGMLTKSFYLSEEISRGKTADAYWREELMPMGGPQGFRRRRDFLKGLAMLFRSLHEKRIYHNDLKDANILVCSGNGHQEESFYLLDLEGIRRYRHLNRQRQIKNLVQLNRTMGKFLRWSEKLYWLKIYLGAVFFDRGEKRKWIGRALEESDRGDRRSLRKR